MKPDDDSRVLRLTLRDTKELRLMKNGCALLQSSCPSVPRHTFARRSPLPVPSLPCHRTLGAGVWPLTPLGGESPMKRCTHADHMSRIIQRGELSRRCYMAIIHLTSLWAVSASFC